MKRIDYFYGQALAGILANPHRSASAGILDIVHASVLLARTLDEQTHASKAAKQEKPAKQRPAWEAAVIEVVKDKPLPPSEILVALRAQGHEVKFASLSMFIARATKAGRLFRPEMGLYQAKRAA